MAEGSFSVDIITCSICLDQLNVPVTIPCGHSYCMKCITDYWNKANVIGVYKCPQCIKIFERRPVVARNILLTDMIEILKETEKNSAVPTDASAGHEEELHTDKPNKSCDVVTEKTEKQKQLEEAQRNVQNIIKWTETNLREDEQTEKEGQTERLLELLKQEIKDPRKTEAELKKLLQIFKYITLLQTFRSDSGLQSQKITAQQLSSMPNLQPRPISLALQPNTSTVLNPCARPISASDSLPWSINMSINNSSSLTTQKPKHWTSISPESEFKTSTGPKRHIRTSTSPNPQFNCVIDELKSRLIEKQ